MKKVIYTLVIIAAGNCAYAQGFLNKVKKKVQQAVEQPAVNTATETTHPSSTSSANVNWTDPSKYGTVIKTFSKSETNDHMGGSDGGFDLWITDIKVVNNQLQMQVADWATTLYNYTNGQLVKTVGTPVMATRNQLYTGSENDMLSKYFSQLDMVNAMMKKGTHVSSGMIPGKPMQTLTFKGKTLGTFYTFQMAHNADSSVIAVVATAIGNGGMKNSLVSSNGQSTPLPAGYGGSPLVSPDGKVSAAYYGQKNEAYLSNGTTVKTGIPSNNQIWLRNSGSVFNLQFDGSTKMYRNGELYYTFAGEIRPDDIFMGPDDKVFAWRGDHGLYFSDGTAFENGMSPRKVTIDGKETVVFLAVNVTSGQVYLVKHVL